VSPADIGYRVQIAREAGEMERGGRGKLVRLGDRAWFEVHDTAFNGVEYVSLSAPLGDEHLLVEASCVGAKCTAEERDAIAEQVAAQVRITRPPTPP
jgi:hypothetical protein